MMETTINDLLLIIGRQQVELEMLRRQVAGMQALLETQATRDLDIREPQSNEAKQIQAQIDGKQALKEVTEKQIERLERIT